MASLFVLRKLSTTWKISPPIPGTESFAPNFYDYANKRILEERRTLPSTVSFQQWFKENYHELRAIDWGPREIDDSLREKPKLVANQLLPLFEEEPEHWEATSFLNRCQRNEAKSFEQYLCNWYKCTPERHKSFVNKVMLLFDTKLCR